MWIMIEHETGLMNGVYTDKPSEELFDYFCRHDNLTYSLCEVKETKGPQCFGAIPDHLFAPKHRGKSKEMSDYIKNCVGID